MDQPKRASFTGHKFRIKQHALLKQKVLGISNRGVMKHRDNSAKWLPISELLGNPNEQDDNNTSQREN